jgi:DNA polymerase III delta prime subunit
VLARAKDRPYDQEMSSDVLILTGPPGVGKTETAGALAIRWERAAHVEADHFFRFIRSGLIAPWREESGQQNEAVIGIVAAAAIGYADAGYFTIVDGILLPNWFYEPLRDALGGAGHRVSYAVLRAPLERCLARAAEREPGGLADPTVVETIWSDFAYLGKLERHVVQVDETMSARETAILVETRMIDGTLRA